MDTDKIMEFIQRPKVIVAGVILFAVIFLTAWGVSTYTEVRNDGNSLELTCTAQWKTMMAHYGQFRLGMSDKLNIAREKREAIGKILTDAVTGRYDKPGQDGTVNGQAVFSAVVEAYPDLKGLNIFDELVKDIQAGREAFAKDQTVMADQVRSYNDWRKGGSWLHPTFVKWAGFPSSNLEVRVGDKVYRGSEALDKMSQPIIGKDAQEIFESGTDKALPTK